MYQFGYFSALNFTSDTNYSPLQKIIRLALSLLLVVWAITIVRTPVLAQPGGEQWLNFKNLDIQEHLPSYLLSRKSVVFVSVPRSVQNPNIRKDWKNLAEKVHPAFRQMKIDAVAYYNLEDLFSSYDATQSFASEMEYREIKYVIVVNQSQANQAGVESYTITVTAFNDKDSFISEGQKAWQMQSPDLSVLLNEMRKDVLRAEMTMENYLIPDMPEFFTDTKILKGKRIPTYAKDLKVDKLVVPRFQKYLVEDSSKLDADARLKIAAYNTEIERKNKRLEEIMLSYPLDYVFSDSPDDEDIYNQGHQYALFSLRGSGKTIREMLNYEIDPYETDYVTIQAGSMLKTLPVEAVVYKFCVKHVYTKDVYLGSRWDADLTWEDALKNLIFHMKDILKVQ